MGFKNLIQTKNLWFADLETFTINSNFFKKHAVYKIKEKDLDMKKCKTVSYCYSLVKIPVAFTPKNPQWHFIKDLKDYNKKIKYGYDIGHMFQTIIYDTEKGRYRYDNVLYFHNGHNFDNYFILSWIKDSKMFKYVNADKIETEKYPYNFFVANMSQGYFLLTLYFWIEEKKKHCRVIINDSRKLIIGSVESISKLYANGIYKDRIQKDFGNLDLNKKPLDIDFITDIDNDYWYLKDGKKVPLNILNSTSWHKNEDIKMIRERVGNDSLIMAIVLAYLIVDGVISDTGSNRIFATIGSVSTMKYAKFMCSKLGLKKEEEKDPKTFWNKYIFKITKEEKQKVNEFFYPWCHGGFCSLNNSYANKLIESNNLKSIDVCSLYPSVCVYNPLPYGNYKTYKKLPKNLNNKFVFVYFEAEEATQLINNCCDMLPLWWNKKLTPYEKETIYNKQHYTKHLRGPIVVYDILPTCKDIWFNENYFKFDGIKNITYYVFEQDYYLKDFMLTMYEAKKNAKNEIQKLSAKLVLNSLTGKFGQKEIKEVGLDLESIADNDTLEDILKEFILVETINNSDQKLQERINNLVVGDTEKLLILKSMEVPHGYFPCYAAITALGRYKTMLTQLKICYNNKEAMVGYSDTDSIKGIFKIDQKELTTNKELGKWSEEWNNQAKFFKYLRPKVWGCATADRNLYKVATGGVNPKKLINHLKTIDNFNMEATIPATQTYRIIGGKVLVDINKKLSQFTSK